MAIRRKSWPQLLAWFSPGMLEAMVRLLQSAAAAGQFVLTLSNILWGV